MRNEAEDTHNEVGESILDAAGKLFEQYGYRKTTIEEIAQEARIGKGTVYLHFKSKEDVGICWLRKLHLHIMGDLDRIAGSDLPATERLRSALIERVMLRVDVFARHQKSIDEAMANLRDLIQERKDAVYKAEADMFEAIICDGIAKGECQIEDPRAAAESMVIATNSLSPYNLRPTQLGNRECVLSKVQALANLLVRAIEVKK